jgi:hypothetical protein
MEKSFTRFAQLTDRIYFIYSAIIVGFLLFEIVAKQLTGNCCGEYFSRHGIELVLRWVFYIVIAFGPLLLVFYFLFQLAQWIRYRRWKRIAMTILLFSIIIGMWFFDVSGPLVALLSLIQLFTGHAPRLL